MGKSGETKNGSSKILGMEFAPLDTPLSRRMETLAVVVWLLPFVLGPVNVLLMLYIFFFTNYAWIASAYFVHFLYDKQTCNRGGRPVNWIRNWSLWKQYVKFFPMHLVKTAELDPSKNYLFAYHPHGFLCSGIQGAFSTEALNFSKLFPGIKPHVLTLELNFSWPLIREYFMAFGACSATRQSMNHLLSKPGGGHAGILVPGGAPEALDSKPGKDQKIHLQRRKGFVKVAIQNGAPLVPVYAFGETELYKQVPNPEGSRLRKFQNFMEKVIGVAPVAVVGRGIFQYTWGMLPKRHPVHIVVGAPIETIKNDKPSQAEIDEIHQKYCDAVLALFNKHKVLYGYDHQTLHLI